MKSSHCKIFGFLLLAAAAFVSGSTAQTSLPTREPGELKGKVKRAMYSRDYLIVDGKSIPPKSEVLAVTYFDEAGQPVQSSIFGKGEQRTIYSRINGETKIELQYFDLNGNPLEDGGKFEANMDVIRENDLCQNYSRRTETDRIAKVDREIETCADGTNRAIVTREYGIKDELIREFREDAKKRTWEYVADRRNADGEIIEYRFIVDVGKSLHYTWTMNYADDKFDSHGNLVQTVGSAFISLRPGQLVFQFVERCQMEYYK